MKCVVALPELDRAMKEEITKRTAAYGITTEFYESSKEATPAMQDADILFGRDAGLCAHAPKLKWACSSTAGVEPYLKPGVFASPDALLSNSSGAYGVTISEHIIMVTLELMRREPEYRDIVRDHAFRRDLKIHSIYGNRITMLGTGDIGQKAAVRLRAFGPERIVGINRSGRAVDAMDETHPIAELDAILPETDLLIMSLPGTKETYHLLDEEKLRRLPADAFLVNVGRGNAIDQKALERVMRSGHLLGAALDVFEQEPLPPEDTLWTCPRVHITPHTAGNVTLIHTLRFIVSMFLEDLDRFMQGKPLKYLVNRKIGY